MIVEIDLTSPLWLSFLKEEELSSLYLEDKADGDENQMLMWRYKHQHDLLLEKYGFTQAQYWLAVQQTIQFNS